MNKRKVVLIDLTDKCTLNCSYCFTSKTQTDMTECTKQQSVQYIADLTKNDNSFYAFCISGGEPGLLDPQQVLDYLNQLKSLNLNAEYILNTNLVYNVTDQQIDVFKQFDSISTTYDYDVRFKQPKQRALFFNNLSIATQCNNRVNLTIILTKQLIESYSPQAMIDLLLSTGVASCEFYRIFVTKNDNSNGSLRPLNEDVNRWLYDVYKLYCNYKRYLKCETFQSIEDAVAEQGCYEYTKYCVDNNRYIDVHGNINQCPAGLTDSFCSVSNYANKQHNAIIRIQQEHKLKQQCVDCCIVQYCNGGCYNQVQDQTGCPVPKKIFELALLNREK